jgi:hypothetical protein
MDKSTQNLIQKATQDARQLLEAEFSRQLAGGIRGQTRLTPKNKIKNIEIQGNTEPKLALFEAQTGNSSLSRTGQEEHGFG